MQKPLLLGARDAYAQFVDDPKTRRFDPVKGHMVVVGNEGRVDKPTTPSTGGVHQQRQLTKRLELMKHFNAGMLLGPTGSKGPSKRLLTFFFTLSSV